MTTKQQIKGLYAHSSKPTRIWSGRRNKVWLKPVGPVDG